MGNEICHKKGIVSLKMQKEKAQSIINQFETRIGCGRNTGEFNDCAATDGGNNPCNFIWK